jgi:hypothetical protein
MWPDIQPVPLSSIDCEDLTYRIATSVDPDDLAPSMQRVGLLYPPVLISEKDMFRIVCGFARVAAAGQLSWKEIPARILPKATSHRSCAEFAVIDACACPPLNPVEQGRCLALLSSITEDTGSLVTWANALGLRINTNMAAKLMVIPQMSHRLQKGLIHQSIALPTALQIHGMADVESVETLSAILLELNFSLNRQRELISWVEAISRQEEKTIHAVLNEPDILAIRRDEQTDIRQKAKMIRQYLKKRRYPSLVQAEERYREYRRQVDLPDQVELVPPPFFEGDTYSLRISFKTPGDLDTIQKKMGKIAASPALSALLKIG